VVGDTTTAVDLAKFVSEVSVSKEPGRVCQRKRLPRASAAIGLAVRRTGRSCRAVRGDSGKSGSISEGME
jgi:hypothetical protein